MCIETYTEYSGFQFQDNDVSQCGSNSNLKAEDLLLIEKNHLEAKAEKARLTSMQNSRTVLTQKQIEQIHRHRMEAIAKKMKKRQIQQI